MNVEDFTQIKIFMILQILIILNRQYYVAPGLQTVEDVALPVLSGCVIGYVQEF